MSDNLVKTIREKTEEGDLDTILKTTLGGYSRSSVREYVSMMRQQQYDMQRSFSEELQLSQTERERLANELAEANTRAAAAQKALAQARPLVEKVAGLEKDMDEAVARIQADAALLEQKNEELQQIRSECDALRARLEERESELCTLRQEKAAGDLAVQTGDVLPAQLTVDAVTVEKVELPESMQVQLAMIARERENNEKRMESVLRQEKRLFQALNECRTELETRRDQNMCMEAENKELSLRLSEQMWQNISLNREITHMRTVNESLKGKLDAARAELTKYTAENAGDLFLWDFEN